MGLFRDKINEKDCHSLPGVHAVMDAGEPHGKPRNDPVYDNKINKRTSQTNTIDINRIQLSKEVLHV